MKNNNNKNSREFFLQRFRLLGYSFFATIIILFCISCEEYDDNLITMAGALTLSASDSEITLYQADDDETSLMFNWTTGTNGGTGASISYVLQIDKRDDNFSSEAISFDMGKSIYTKSLAVGELNDSLLERWSFTANVSGTLEARVIATIYSTPVQYDTSSVVTIAVTPYEPVSTTLYMIGDATPNGWDASNATELTPDKDDPTTFIYSGTLYAGELSFITTLGQELPAYGKGNSDDLLSYENDNASSVIPFSIFSTRNYKITLNLLDLSFSIENGPAYSHIFIVGNATPNGWDYVNATELEQDDDNPFIFTYSGILEVGEFKFPVTRDPDGNQDMYMRESNSTMYLHHGGDADDNNWTIEKRGYYTITMNLKDLTISVERRKIYIIGSATSAKWDIGNAIEMKEDATDGCIFTYSGAMTEGEFKFPINQNTDWAQDMYMKVDNTAMYLHHGGDDDDNKWTITAAGDYVITINIDLLTIDILKQ